MDKEKALKKLTNGYYIVTALKPAEEMATRDKDYLAAATVNWISQLAFEPPTVGVSVGIYSDLNETIDHSGKFTVHVLSDKHMDLIEKFASDSNVTADKINGVPYRKDNNEVVIDDALAFLECKVTNTVRCGDHTLHVGEVIKAKVNKDISPLSTVALPSSYSPEKAKS